MATLKQPPQMTAQEIAHEVTDVRLEYENLRVEMKALGTRTSQLYV